MRYQSKHIIRRLYSIMEHYEETIELYFELKGYPESTQRILFAQNTGIFNLYEGTQKTDRYHE